jgi:hypothetical protein
MLEILRKALERKTPFIENPKIVGLGRVWILRFCYVRTEPFQSTQPWTRPKLNQKSFFNLV